MNRPMSCTNLVRFGPVTPEFRCLIGVPVSKKFAKKSAYFANYLRTYWTDLNQIFRLDRYVDVDDIRFEIVYGTLLW